MMQIIDFIEQWREHPAGRGRRSDLEVSDMHWEELYNRSLDKNDPLNEQYVEPGTLLFRVHQKQNHFMSRDEYLRLKGTNVFTAELREQYNKEATEYERNVALSDVDYDNHWVSFTKDVSVILDTYFYTKGMNGDVIVIKSDKAFDISEIFRVYEECEVVAPLDKKDVVEVLSYEDFKDKYGKVLD